MHWRDVAHAFIEPYKAAVRARVLALRARAAAFLHAREAQGGGRLMETLLRMRERIRRT